MKIKKKKKRKCLSSNTLGECMSMYTVYTTQVQILYYICARTYPNYRA